MTKKETVLSMLSTGKSIFVHLDPRYRGVIVPEHLRGQSALVLQLGLNMAISIPDLDVSDTGIHATLSFNRQPHYCELPWNAIYGLVHSDGEYSVWESSMPPEVLAGQQQEKTLLPTPTLPVGTAKKTPPRSGKPRPSYLRLVK